MVTQMLGVITGDHETHSSSVVVHFTVAQRHSGIYMNIQIPTIIS